MTSFAPESEQPSALLRLASECAADRRFDEAVVHLQKLLELEPRHEIAAGMLAAVYAEMKQPARAMPYFQLVLELNPGNTLARSQMGLLQLTAGQPEAALQTLAPSLQEPDDYLAHFHSALALLQLKRPGEAGVLLRVAEQRMPKDHWLYPQLQTLLPFTNNPASESSHADHPASTAAKH